MHQVLSPLDLQSSGRWTEPQRHPIPPYLPRPPDRCRGLAGEDHCQGGAPAAQRGRTTLMVIFPGERLPGDRRTARPSVRARRRGSVAARYRLLPVAGQETGGGARDRWASARRSRAGRRPEVAEQPRHSPAAPGGEPHAASRTPAERRDPFTESAPAGTARRARRACP